MWTARKRSPRQAPVQMLKNVRREMKVQPQKVTPRSALHLPRSRKNRVLLKFLPSRHHSLHPQYRLHRQARIPSQLHLR